MHPYADAEIEDIIRQPMSSDAIEELRRRWWIEEARELAGFLGVDASESFITSWAVRLREANDKRMEKL